MAKKSGNKAPMRVRTVEVHRGTILMRYLDKTTKGVKNLRNVANFYIRNTMTGLKKPPEERTHNETEVLHYVFTGIQKANEASRDRTGRAYVKVIREIRTEGIRGLAAHAMVHRVLDTYKPISYPTTKKWRLSYRQLDAILKYKEDPCYYRLPAQVNQQALKKTEASWDAYFASLKDWKKNPGKYKARPGIPKYLHTDASTATFPNQILRAEERGGGLILHLPCSGKLTIKVGGGIRAKDIVQLEARPYCGGYKLCVTYEGGAAEPDMPEKPSKIMGIDLGVANLFSCACNFPSIPFVIKGGYIKSLNQWFNKERARLSSAVTAGLPPEKSQKGTKRLYALSRKRDRRFRDLFYKCAHYICRTAVSFGVEAVVVGWNPDIKQRCGMGKANNQAFITIPHMQAYQILKNVAASYGLPVTKREESYTSKASFLDMDEIPVYGTEDAGKTKFSGVRGKRGLYTAKDGRGINADINGACNIIRKEYPDAFCKVKDLGYLTGAVEAVTCEQLLGINKLKKPGKHKRKHMSDARKINRREHRYKKRDMERVFTGMSGKTRIEAAKEKAIAEAKAKEKAVAETAA